MKIKRVETVDEIIGIKELQTANLKKNLSPEEQDREGFVTAEYSLDFLKKMNELEPSIIAVDKERVVGYALVAVHELKGGHDLLDDLFEKIDQLKYRDTDLTDSAYVLVGQLCVAKSHRGQNLVGKIYAEFKRSLAPRFAYCLTDVDMRNPRSIKSHEKVGFEILHEMSYGGSHWKIIIWDWTDTSS